MGPFMTDEIDEADDDHRGIPRDAEGDPIYLILPPDMRAEYERKLAACRAGWEATRDPAAPMEALVLALNYRQPPQLWFVEAACAVMHRRRTRGYVTRRINATIRWMRFAAVRDAVRSGLTWLAAYQDASDKLARTAARGEPGTMKAAYDEVIRDLREGRSALYTYTPTVPKFGAAQTRAPTREQVATNCELGHSSTRKP
jgi:hypothetical protein